MSPVLREISRNNGTNVNLVLFIELLGDCVVLQHFCFWNFQCKLVTLSTSMVVCFKNICAFKYIMNNYMDDCKYSA